MAHVRDAVGELKLRFGRWFVVLGLALGACSSGVEPTSAEAEGIAFPVVDDFPADGVPVFRERGFASVEGSVPESDQIALIARVDGTGLNDAVSIRAFVGDSRFVRSETVIDGRTVSISGDSTSIADVVIATLGDLPEPGLLVEIRGVDPVDFLANGGLQGISASVTTGNEPRLDLTEPPDGYTIVIPPTNRYHASPHVAVDLEGAATRVQTTLDDPRFEYVPQANFEQVVIGERNVWRSGVGTLSVAIWEEPEGVFTRVISPDSARTDAIVRATRMTDESSWRDFYGIDRPSGLLATLDGREFEAVFYEGYPFDPAAEDRPLTIAFTDDTIIIRGVCSSRNARVTSRGDTVEAAGSIQVVGAGCEFEDVDAWQNELASSVLSLSLTDAALTVRATIGDDDVLIEMTETSFSGYS